MTTALATKRNFWPSDRHCRDLHSPLDFDSDLPGVQNLLDIVPVISPMIGNATSMALVVMSGTIDITVQPIAYVASALFAALIMRNGLSFSSHLAISIMAGLALGCVNAAITRSPSEFINRYAWNNDRLPKTGLFMTDSLLSCFFPFHKISRERFQVCSLCRPQYRPNPSVGGTVAAPPDDVRGQLFAIGNNEDVARRIGIPVDQRTVAT